MAKKIGRMGIILFVILSILAGTTALIGPTLVKKQAEKSFPAVTGSIPAAGLEGEVQIYRDSYGVPHIYASSHHDLFFAQGYVHAQDRFFQMDFWRHMGAGRLSELLGKPMLETDKFIRTLGWERVAQQELNLLGEEEQAILEAYSSGVNAYLADINGTSLSLEYYFLDLINKDYQPDSWTPLNSLTWGKAMAWDLRSNLDTEIDRALLLKTLPRNQLEFLYPDYPDDHPLIVPGYTVSSQQKQEDLTDSAPAFTSGLVSLLEDLKATTSLVDRLTGGGYDSLGSNSWAVHGDLTDTGKPYLMNDPHLGAQIPSIWYEVGLHCQDKTESCQLDVAGFSFAGVPGVVIGHNNKIAWGFTNLGPDVMDLYIEKINPENPTLYQTPDGWQEMELIQETIQIAGEDPVEYPVYLTEHGPVIGSVYGLEDFDKESGLAIPENYALAVRWTALEPSCVFCSIWEINLASSWKEFRQAARSFTVPAQNLIFADIEGNIAYQTPGNIPIRVEGHDGMLPVPGWNREYEWQGYIPFEELPFALNPSAGYIVTANNKPAGAAYPYLISEQWDLGYRAQRIVDLLEDRQDPITLTYLKRMQRDNYDGLAELLVPFVLDQRFTDPELRTAQDLLRSWNYQADQDSAPAALYMVFWQNLVNNTLQDNLPTDYQVGVDSRAKEIIRRMISQPDNLWWDNPATAGREYMGDIIRLTLTESYRELEKELGRDPSTWQWGDLHTITFQHQVMNSFPIIKRVFNQGPYPSSGGSALINATGWNSEDPYEIDWLPSMRMIVDLNDLTNSLSIHTTGQSGHTYHPHYTDMVDLWRKGYYHPLLWDRDHVQRQAEAVLTLTPP
jgi:penicillin amidase